jgi:hypothetical protein
LWKDVAVTRLDPRRFDAVLEPAQCGRFLRRLEQAADRLEGRRLWHLNSTEQGGGVAEMLRFLFGYLAGAGIDVRWVVLGGDQRFFEVTKRLHNLLHGHPGDGNGLDRPERNVYQQTLQEAGEQLRQRVAPGDVVVLHDPQTVAQVHRLAAHHAHTCARLDPVSAQAAARHPAAHSRPGGDQPPPPAGGGHADPGPPGPGSWRPPEVGGWRPPEVDGADPEVARLLAVLATAGPAGLTVTELLVATGRQKTWVYERLADLQQAALVERAGQGRYRLSRPPTGGREAGS